MKELFKPRKIEKEFLNAEAYCESYYTRETYPQNVCSGVDFGDDSNCPTGCNPFTSEMNSSTDEVLF